MAKLLLLEPYTVGRKAQLRHEATLARLAYLLRAGRERVGAESLPGVLEEGLVGGAAFIVLRPLRVGEADLLPALGPERQPCSFPPTLVASRPSGSLSTRPALRPGSPAGRPPVDLGQ